jgi:homoserine O-acetyltransferase
MTAARRRSRQHRGRQETLMTCVVAIALVVALLPRAAAAQAAYPPAVEADFVARDVRFASGDVAPEIRLHYRTIGRPRRDASGAVTNGVLILHGTGGSGRGFLSDGYAGRLFGKGQLLDAERFFIILPDNIGHGQSSKPSDGLRMRFPPYRYADMVRLQHRLVTEGLGLTRLHLIMGTSMGAMHSWMWGYMYPSFADGLVPLASNPVEIAGRNRVWRKLLVDAIVTDPTWKGGEYTEPPRGLASALGFLLMATSVPLQWQQQFPTGEAADAWLADQIASRMKTTDANDTIYHFRASEDYDPSPHLGSITAPLLAINSADDFVNPPELPMMQQMIGRVRRGRFVLVPTSEATRGHGTHSRPEVFGPYLAEFLAGIARSPSQ